MKTVTSVLSAILLGCTLCGCSNTPPEKEAKQDAKHDGKKSSNEEAIKKALAQLGEKDQKLAETQKFCPIEPEQRLGAMGKPFKIELGGKTVFLCCASCKKSAAKNEQETLKKVEELRAANKTN